MCLVGVCTQASQSIWKSRMDWGSEIKGQQASLQVGPHCEGEVWTECIFNVPPVEGEAKTKVKKNDLVLVNQGIDNYSWVLPSGTPRSLMLCVTLMMPCPCASSSPRLPARASAMCRLYSCAGD